MKTAPRGFREDQPRSQPGVETTVKTKLGVWVVCEDRPSESHQNGTTAQTRDIRQQLDSSTRTQKSPRDRGLVTHGDRHG